MIVTSVPTQQQQKFKTWMYVAGENWKVTLLFEHLSYMGDFANYWQAFVPHPLRFGYHFVSVYYHLKEHYVNFFRFFKVSLTTLYTHRVIEFSKTLISNNFLLRLWISKKISRRISM